MNLEVMGVNTRHWVASAEDRDYWRDFVNAALNLRVSYPMKLINFGLKTNKDYTKLPKIISKRNFQGKTGNQTPEPTIST